MDRLILASCSPRRSELLESAGIPFETVRPDVDESCSLPAEEAVAVLSARKAAEVGKMHPGRFILAADTLVAVDGRPLGKPVTAAEQEAPDTGKRQADHRRSAAVEVGDPEGSAALKRVGTSLVHGLSG